jgi:hypothetical protein
MATFSGLHVELRKVLSMSMVRLERKQAPSVQVRRLEKAAVAARRVVRRRKKRWIGGE